MIMHNRLYNKLRIYNIVNLLICTLMHNSYVGEDKICINFNIRFLRTELSLHMKDPLELKTLN